MAGSLLTTAAGLAQSHGPERIDAARASLARDLESWRRFTFQRDVLRQRLDRRANVYWQARYRFLVTPKRSGFEEELLEINGRVPTAREARLHRKAGRFGKHYRAAVAAKISNPIGDDLPLSPLLFDQQHRWVERQSVEGIACDRFRFDSRPEVAGATRGERLKRALSGNFCLSTEGDHIVEATLSAERSVSGGGVRIESFRLSYQSRPVDGSWLPRVFALEIRSKVGPKRFHRSNRYSYDEYRRLVED